MPPTVPRLYELGGGNIPITVKGALLPYRRSPLRPRAHRNPNSLGCFHEHVFALSVNVCAPLGMYIYHPEAEE